MTDQTLQCPYCHSWHVVTKNIGRKVGTTLGATGGAVHGISGALAGARTGTTLGTRIGIVAGPLGASLGGIAGAVLGAIIGATTFGFMGAKLGELVDNTILDNYHCLDCGQTFNPTRFMSDIPLLETSNLSNVSATSRYDPCMIDHFVDDSDSDAMDGAIEHSINDWGGSEGREADEPTSSLSYQGENKPNWPVIPYDPSVNSDSDTDSSKGNDGC